MKEVFKKTNYEIKNKELLEQVFTHKSYNSQNHNERLEFLGDAVLDLVITDLLFQKFEDLNEGDLTKIKSHLVSGAILSEMALELHLDKYLKVGKKVPTKTSRILAGTLEAYLAAIYKDAGFSKTQTIIQSLFDSRVTKSALFLDYKTSLQEKCQKTYQTIPEYRIEKEEGLQHKKMFFVSVYIHEECKGSGAHSKKRQAEQLAAKEALSQWDQS